MAGLKHCGALSILAASLCFATNAQAFDIVTVGVGFIGHAGGNFLDKPGDQTVAGQNVTPNYPGFAGMTTGFGAAIDVRFIDYVGIEFDILSTHDKGEADITVTDTATGAQSEYTIEIGHDAIHLPLLVKGVLPGEIVSPTLFVGPEFVIPSEEAEFSVSTGSNSTPFGAVTESYTMVTFGMGLEFNLPLPMDFMQVRIPFSLRGSVTPSVSDSRYGDDGRSVIALGPNGLPSSEEYKTVWKFQAAATLGVSVHF